MTAGMQTLGGPRPKISWVTAVTVSKLMGIRPISSTWRVLGTHRYPDLWDIYIYIYLIGIWSLLYFIAPNEIGQLG